MTPSCIFFWRLLSFLVFIFAFIDFLGPRDSITGGGLLIQGGGYIHRYVCVYNVYIGLQFTEKMMEGKVKLLSGGWRMRVSLAKAVSMG